MRGGPAHIKVVDGRAVVSPTGNGAEEEELFEGKFALKNVALREAEFAFEIERRKDLAANDEFFDIGRVLGDGFDHVITEGFALVVPGALRQLVRRVLHEAGEYVLARWSYARIRQARYDHIDVGSAGEMAVLGVVVSALHVLDARGDRNRAAKVRAGPGHGFEIGEAVESDVHFAGGPTIFIAAHTLEKISGQLAGLQEFFERKVGIDAGGNHGSGYFLAGFQDDAGGTSIFHENSIDWGLRSNLDPGFAGGRADRIGNCAGAAAAETPRTERAVNFSHVVMQ